MDNNDIWRKIFNIQKSVCDETEHRNALFKILKMYNADEYLYNYYFRIDDNDIIIIGDFMLYSINSIVDAYKDFVDAERDKEILIAQQYEIGYTDIGMGHTCVLVYDSRVRKYYFRHGGGSDGNAVSSTCAYFNSDMFDPTAPEYAKYLFDFPSIIQCVIDKKFGSFMIMD